MTEIAALCGGVGGAKLAQGLASILGDKLALIVNTGDDFTHLGLHISPDIDTTMYTLAGAANKTTGWGIEGESWNFLAQLRLMGGPDWFKLGDRDLAMHILRTDYLRKGRTLTDFSLNICEKLGIAARILPMSNDSVRTFVHTDQGTLEFQEYFVRLQAKATVRRIEFVGSGQATISPEIVDLARKQLNAIIICPSNPYLSVDPILAISGIRGWVEQSDAPVIAVSPVVGGAAIKGPTASIMRNFGLEPNALAIANHYRNLIDGLLIDDVDATIAKSIERTGIQVRVTNTVMRTEDDRATLAQTCLAFAREISGSRSVRGR